MKDYNEKTFISNSAEKTQSIAEEFAKDLSGGEVLIVKGGLGAGKTTFTQGLAKGLGVMQQIISPTFTIVKEYCGSSVFLYHIDMYRIEDVQELENLGLEELFSDDSIVVIEWNKKENITAKKVYEIQIDIQTDKNRVLIIKDLSRTIQ
ncbi:MAG: tRNA (adenosine(37)-N6)-threonylcarbamoyltransferase complex ATPase subunit type 1 TsaE [Clostridiales bacterium]|jgi:tRNA threonylcarbamoyladenosine biosynthesis protein TsaE|nr:tRNA (adenosine(37)-N6)-threonylcarbamoyltransferase complex ATPase subunit type 1 TsaE [Clostridiales bacterium]